MSAGRPTFGPAGEIERKFSQTLQSIGDIEKNLNIFYEGMSYLIDKQKANENIPDRAINNAVIAAQKLTGLAGRLTSESQIDTFINAELPRSGGKKIKTFLDPSGYDASIRYSKGFLGYTWKDVIREWEKRGSDSGQDPVEFLKKMKPPMIKIRSEFAAGLYNTSLAVANDMLAAGERDDSKKSDLHRMLVASYYWELFATGASVMMDWYSRERKRLGKQFQALSSREYLVLLRSEDLFKQIQNRDFKVTLDTMIVFNDRISGEDRSVSVRDILKEFETRIEAKRFQTSLEEFMEKDEAFSAYIEKLARFKKGLYNKLSASYSPKNIEKNKHYEKFKDSVISGEDKPEQAWILNFYIITMKQIRFTDDDVAYAEAALNMLAQQGITIDK